MAETNRAELQRQILAANISIEDLRRLGNVPRARYMMNGSLAYKHATSQEDREEAVQADPKDCVQGDPKECVQGDPKGGKVVPKRRRVLNAKAPSASIIRTRAQVARQKQDEFCAMFTRGFRNLSAEIKRMIFDLVIEPNCKDTPAVIIGLRSKHVGEMDLHKAAWEVFCLKNAFFLCHVNSYTTDQDLHGGMPLSVWKTIRALNIKHDYMKQLPSGLWRMWYHGPEPLSDSRYRPCARCDFHTIMIAPEVRDLHLNFDDSYHCILPIVQRTCKLAIQNMKLVRLTVTVSNLLTYYSCAQLRMFLDAINYHTGKTAYLYEISTRQPDHSHYAPRTSNSMSWFWCAGAVKKLEWVEDWAWRGIKDEDQMRKLYGEKRPGDTRDLPLEIDSDDAESDDDAQNAHTKGAAMQDTADTILPSIEEEDGASSNREQDQQSEQQEQEEGGDDEDAQDDNVDENGKASPAPSYRSEWTPISDVPDSLFDSPDWSEFYLPPDDLMAGLSLAD